jgi:aspartate 1-decarboxylase
MAHIGEAGDLVILITYAQVDDSELAAFRPRIVHVDQRNRPKLRARDRVAVN